MAGEAAFPNSSPIVAGEAAKSKQGVW